MYVSGCERDVPTARWAVYIPKIDFMLHWIFLAISRPRCSRRCECVCVCVMIHFSSRSCAALDLFYAFCSPVFSFLFRLCIGVYVSTYYYDNEINHFFIEDLFHSLLVCVCVCVCVRDVKVYFCVCVLCLVCVCAYVSCVSVYVLCVYVCVCVCMCVCV